MITDNKQFLFHIIKFELYICYNVYIFSIKVLETISLLIQF